MSGKIKKLFEENKIKYWKIGTSFNSYKSTILKWFEDPRFVNEIKDNKILVKKNGKENEEDRPIIAEFSSFSEIPVYYQQKIINNNIHKYQNATIMQFLHVLKYLGIIYEENKNFVFTPDFINFVTEEINDLINEEEKSKKLNAYLSKILNETLMEQLLSKITELENSITNIKEISEEVNFLFSLWYEGFVAFIEREERKNWKFLKKYFEKTLKIQKNHHYFEELSYLIASEKIVEVAKIIHNSFGVLDQEIEKILKCDNVKSFANESSKKQGKPKVEGSYLISVLDFFNWFTEGIYIPIFQRSFVWNDDAIRMMIESIITDMKKILKLI